MPGDDATLQPGAGAADPPALTCCMALILRGTLSGDARQPRGGIPAPPCPLRGAEAELLPFPLPPSPYLQSGENWPNSVKGLKTEVTLWRAAPAITPDSRQPLHPQALCCLRWDCSSSSVTECAEGVPAPALQRWPCAFLHIAGLISEKRAKF